MIIKFLKFNIKVCRPIVFIGNESCELAFRLKKLNKLPVVYPKGYAYKDFDIGQRERILILMRKAGFNFFLNDLDEIINKCIPGGIHLIEEIDSGNLVSMMMSRHLGTRKFLFGGRIDWLVTDPEHQGKKLGTLSASLAINHLIDRGYENIWVTTQLSRPAAIKIFTSLGFEIEK